ncbi:hypothetical protein [Roseomonas sp. CECT 9278]|uniref:hypothetical protein n=1 Tax=Roseomonas sp. CECT 9278 TaxID=2845823 RepID=UPI001E2D5A64|nr:hypothetical protein [Roseomonas sp. CECT 9278]CAH0158368.1 hypothetical protein ROS9278_00900 [Roseomonas sp. CECT 9278]
MKIESIPTGTTDVPIVIFSFDRPDYLETLCRGLAAQVQLKPDPARVHLMQDGAVSQLTGRRHGDPALIARSIAVFRAHFPDGHVHAAEHNLGIAENILRGQALVFEDLDAPVGYFFEDDLEPGPLYLAAMEGVRRATEPFADQVGHFAAYGDHRKRPPGPEVGFRQLGHHWAFGLRREAWRRIQAWLPDWWDEIRRNDYRARNKRRLLELWRTRRVARDAVTQDAANELACAELGLARIGTDVCFGRYIGQEGQHFSPAIFRKLGFEGLSWAEAELFRFGPLAQATVQHIAQRAFNMHARFRQEELETTIATMDAERDDPDRLASEAEIRALWHLLLDRRQVPAPYLARHAGRSTIRAVRRDLVRRSEFERSTGP